ncbi:MAG: DNA-binding protein [Tannerellaceae bacterium]|jgi:predicted histone-like DNA-binding protein|nr:DNA-binding protein [Tannerellaceae bacterium]
MGLIYDFYKNPSPEKNEGKSKLHARVVTSGTVGTAEIAALIQSSSTLTTGDINAALTMFRQEIIRQLSDSKRVHWEGVGYFELSLSCPAIESPKEIRAESIHPKTIIFRPEKSFKKEFRYLPLTRSREKRHSNQYKEEELDKLLTRYFRENMFLTSSKFRKLCGFTQATASRRLRKLYTDGKLRKTGHHRSPLYEPTEGYYGR